MQDYLQKIKCILPYYILSWSASVIPLYLLRWLLSSKFKLVSLNEEIWELYIPMAIPWIPLLLWFRQRFRTIQFKKKDDDAKWFVFVVAWLSISASVIASQQFFTGNSLILKHVSTPEAILVDSEATCYTIDTFNIDQHYAGTHTEFKVTGKHGTRLDFTVYFVSPIYSNQKTSNKDNRLWCGVKFHDSMSYSADQEVKNKRYKEFYAECVNKLNNYKYHKSNYFKKETLTEDRANYDRAIEARIEETPLKNNIVIVPVNSNFNGRNGNLFNWIFYFLAIGITALLGLLIIPHYNGKGHKALLSGKIKQRNDLTDYLKFLIPSGDHFWTSIFVNANILVFIVMVLKGINPFFPAVRDLYDIGGITDQSLLNEEYYRLVTCLFIHGGIIHLFYNMAVLIAAGLFIEKQFGRGRFFILYLLSGICGALASAYWHDNVVSVGASGAIYGLLGSYIGLIFIGKLSYKENRGALMIIGIYVGIGLLYSLFSNTDIAAHFGGMIGGLIFGILLSQGVKDKKSR
jgi:rhomboid protease GluP